MIDVIVTNFETFADVYIKILVIAYIFSMALILSLWLKPFVYSPGSAYIPAGVFFVLRFILLFVINVFYFVSSAYSVALVAASMMLP